MKLKKILGNLFGTPKEKTPEVADVKGAPPGPQGATGPKGAPEPQPRLGYLALRQKAIDIEAGRRGVLAAKARRAVPLRLAKLHEWMREGNEARRFTREIQLERRAELDKRLNHAEAEGML
jgi:hypothetical protein